MLSRVGIPEAQEHLSVADYLEGEERSEVRHEYIGGRVYGMSGGSEAHNTISLNLAAAIRGHLRGKPCRAFVTGMKLRLRIAGEDIFYYPDVFVTCDPADDESFYKTSPVLVIEVLSFSTERLDRREKFLGYTGLSTLREYLLVEQERKRLTVFRKETGWKPEYHEGDAAVLRLESIGLELPLSEVYEDVPIPDDRR